MNQSTSRRTGRRLMTALAAVFITGAVVATPFVGAVAPASGATPASTSTTSSPDAAVTDFGGCIAGGGSGDLLLLMDDSGSLKQSDADDDRVQAAQYLVRQLGRFADQTGSDIAVRVARFSTNYADVGGWTALDGKSVSTVADTVAGLADADDGFETDYWSALDGARGDLAARASSRSGTSCQAIAWFTDGKAEYVVRGTQSAQDSYGTTKPFAPGVELTSQSGVDEATAAADKDLCRAGGLADQLRSSGVTTFAIGLESSGAPANDFAQLEAIATGSSASPKTTCGSINDPIPGSFTLASDIDNLLFAFDALSTPGQAPLSQESGICQVSYCTDQAHDFVLDDSTPDVHVLAAADVDAVDVDIVGPDGKPVQLPRSAVGTEARVAVPGGTASYTWESNSAVSIDISRADGATAWAGLWKVVFIDPAGTSADKRSRTNIHISSDLVPTWSGSSAARVHLQDAWPGTFGIADGDGEEVPPSSVRGTATLTAILADEAGHRQTVLDAADKEHLSGPITAEPTGLDLGAGTVEMRLDLTTAPVLDGTTVVHEGTTLAPAVVRVPVSVLAPSQFPEVTDSVDFGTLDGETSATAVLRVTGSGCAWISGEPKIAAAPSDTGDVAVTAEAHDSSSTCVRASKSGRPLEVTLTFDESQNGTVNGTFPVRIASADGAGEPLTTNVSFTADLRRPLNEANFLLALVVALIAGPGIPLALLYLASFLVARMPSGGLLSQRSSVTVVDGRVMRDGVPFAFRPTDFTTMQTISGRNARSLVVAGLSLRARPSRSPFTAGFVIATEPGSAAASDVAPASIRLGGGLRAWLPLAIQGHWVVLAPVGSSAGTAEVVAFVGSGAPDSVRTAIADSIRDRLPEVLDRLRDAAGEMPDVEHALAGVSTGRADVSSLGFGTGAPPADRPAESTPPPSQSGGDDVGFGFGFEDGPRR
ncbi:hypothetical protein DEJ21_13825 [Curtobacterium sp. MCSS17_006]|nr:hypothetical protein DEJ21_13825 [Curtobacterium sp. MCSS17_006]